MKRGDNFDAASNGSGHSFAASARSRRGSVSFDVGELNTKLVENVSTEGSLIGAKNNQRNQGKVNINIKADKNVIQE